MIKSDTRFKMETTSGINLEVQYCIEERVRRFRVGEGILKYTAFQMDFEG